MQGKWSHYLASVALIAAASAASYAGETITTGQATGWSVLLAGALSAAGKAVLTHLQRQQPPS